MTPTTDHTSPAKPRVHSERGATSVEYAIMASAIAAVIVLVVSAIGLQTLGLFQGLLDVWP